MPVITDPFDLSMKGLQDPFIVTFQHAAFTKADEGKVVSITADKTVSLTANGNKFDGSLDFVDEKEKVCGVRLGPIFELPYSGAAPAFGRALLVADAAGKVKTDAGGDPVLVLSVDTTKTTVVFQRV
jgi:hypothetical protein